MRGFMGVLGAVGAVACLLGAGLLSMAPTASADTCPNAVFRTGPSASLPDCRAYEMVTPPFKSGGVVYVGDSVQGALNGSNILLNSVGGFGETLDNGGASGAFYSVARTAAGWISTPVDPSLSQFLVDGNGVTERQPGLRQESVLT